MNNLKSYKKIIQQFGKENVFDFIIGDQIYLIVGYPLWRGFIINPLVDLRLEVHPEINAATRKLGFLDRIKSEANARLQLKVEDPKLLESYLEKERKFFETIPQDIINRVKVFVDSHWEIIKSAAIYGHHFITLLDSNPVLAYMLVNIDKIKTSFSINIHNLYMTNLVDEKQKKILKYAGFPATKSIVKLFSKFDPAMVDLSLLKSFQQNIRTITGSKDEVMKVLSHIKTINKNLLKIILSHPNILIHITVSALHELIVSVFFNELLVKIVKMSADAEAWDVPFKLDGISNINKADVNLQAAIQRRKDEVTSFPTPPIPDGDGIIALRTVAQQISWGKQQQNCIHSYVDAVKQRKCHLYKVIFGNEEATLEIKINNRRYFIGEIKGVHDIKVSPELRNLVEHWFYSSRKYKKRAVEWDFFNS